MTKLYTGFSNYHEMNVNSRENAAETEVYAWNNEKDQYRKYREEWNQAANNGHLPSHPLHVDIELSDACNLRCTMCAHGIGTANSTGFMNRELAIKTIDECSSLGVYSVKFNWRGESALNPLLPELVRYAKAKGILEVQINTNGVPKKREIYIDCAKAGIDRIIFSIDGHTSNIFEQIRIGAKLNELKENIFSLLEWKKKTAQTKPLIRVQFVRTKINASEADDFLNYWNPMVDDVRISDVMDRGQGNAMSVGDQVMVGRRRCPQPFQRLIVARDGRVSPCCADWDQNHVVGDVAKQNLSDIWHGEKMTYMRNIQDNIEHDRINICRKCYVKESYLWENT